MIVVDSSPDHVFAANHRAFGGFTLHLRPEPRHRCANGKVHNVLTGLDHVSTWATVIADDDVRYAPEQLDVAVALLADADLVVPQNVFVAEPGHGLPWHAHWDTARTLLNRVTGGDFPGTLAFRTDALRRSGGYDGDVLFENLELMRTVAATGGTILRADDLYVPRRPPTTGHFGGQRVRQAYDEFARPVRLLVQLMIVPLVVWSAMRSWRVLAGCSAAVVVAAEVGRRRLGGDRHFPVTSSLLAPAWLIERGCCAWLALAARARGGVPYAGSRLRTAAHPTRRLRRAAHAVADDTVTSAGHENAAVAPG